MPDANIQEIDAAVANISRFASSLAPAADALRARAEAERKMSFDMKKASGALGALVSSASEAHSFFANALGGTAVLGTFVKLVGVGNDLTKTYRNMVEHGQNFNGSLLNMAKSAADAGMPLDDFADAISKSSVIVARMGVKSFGEMNKAINTQLIQYGMLGMTQEQVSKNLSSYMEIQRQSGLIEKNTTRETSKNFTDLMVTTTALSAATGVARDDIMKLAETAIDSSMASSRFQTMSLNEGKEANKKFQQSMVVLSSQAGEAGSFLAGLHANAVGTGNAAFTDQGKTLISAGLGNLGAMFENVKGPEEMVATQERFRKELTANLPLLRSLALGTGESASAAQELLKVQKNMKPLTATELRQKQEQAKKQDGITKMFESFSTIWNQMTASFKSGFLDGFKPLFAGVGDITKSDTVKKLGLMMTHLGKSLGGFVTFWLDPKNLTRIGDAFKKTAHVLGVMGSILGTVVHFLGKIGSTLATYPKLLGTVAAALTGLLVLKKLKGLFNSDKFIKANNVYVNGKGGGFGGGDDIGGPGGPKGKGRGGFWNHVKRGFREGGRDGYGGERSSLWKGLLGAGKGAGTGLKSMTRGLGGSLKGGMKGVGGLLGRAAGPMLGVGMEGLDYIFGDKALTGKNLLKSTLSLGGGALGAIGGGLATGGLGGEFIGGAAGYAGGSSLADWLLGDDDSKSAIAAQKRSKLAMTGAGAGAAGLGIAGANMVNSLGNGPPEVATPANDPLVEQLKQVNNKLDSLNTATVAGHASVAKRVDEQKGMLRGVINKPA